jgi:hypothetical protein
MFGGPTAQRKKPPELTFSLRTLRFAHFHLVVEIEISIRVCHRYPLSCKRTCHQTDARLETAIIDSHEAPLL